MVGVKIKVVKNFAISIGNTENGKDQPKNKLSGWYSGPIHKFHLENKEGVLKINMKNKLHAEKKIHYEMAF